MKIVSNFKDYYDSVIGYGVDKTIQYKRFKKVIDVNKSIIKVNTPYHWDDNTIKIDSFFVLFCNEIHIGYRLSKPQKNRTYSFETEDDIAYGLDDVKKFFSDIKEKKIKPYRIKRWHWHYVGWKEEIKKYEEKSKQIRLKDDWHVHYQSPIIIVDFEPDAGKMEGSRKVICNPQLKKWKFQKVKDPYTAFQQISMYISNIFGLPGNEMVEVSEKTKIQKHGFDKWSFRKMKETKC